LMKILSKTLAKPWRRKILWVRSIDFHLYASVIIVITLLILITKCHLRLPLWMAAFRSFASLFWSPKWWPGQIVSNASSYQSNASGYQSWPGNAAAMSTICFPKIWMMKEWWCSVLSNLLPNPAQWQTKQLVTTKTDSSLIVFSQWIHHALHYLSDRYKDIKDKKIKAPSEWPCL
jgi:hypothetical protein